MTRHPWIILFGLMGVIALWLEIRWRLRERATEKEARRYMAEVYAARAAEEQRKG